MQREEKTGRKRQCTGICPETKRRERAEATKARTTQKRNDCKECKKESREHGWVPHAGNVRDKYRSEPVKDLVYARCTLQ